MCLRQVEQKKTTTMPQCTCQGQTLSFTTRPHIRNGDSQNFFKSATSEFQQQLTTPANWSIIALWPEMHFLLQLWLHRVTATKFTQPWHPILDFTKLWAEAALAASSRGVEKSLGHKPQLKKWRKQKGLQAVHLQTIYRLWLRSDCWLFFIDYDYVLPYWLHYILTHIDYFFIYFSFVLQIQRHSTWMLSVETGWFFAPNLSSVASKTKSSKNQVVKLVKVIWWFLFYMKSSAKSGLAPRAL